MSEYNYDYNYEPVATVSKGAKVKGIIAMVLGHNRSLHPHEDSYACLP
ncbi:MAG: hypothetical protein II350_04405 [Clostridia bacterium]|nr:hypothetical protein [Clostridia bacterium]